MRRQVKSPQKINSKAALMLASLFQGMISKRKSYFFQLIKQFILFPDQSDSSGRTISKYDKLIFSDEQVHSMFKILETKLIQNKIWGFINLRMLPYIRAAKKMEKPIKRLKKRIEKQNVIFTFQSLKTYAFTKISQQIRSPVKKQSSSYTHIKITETQIKQQIIRLEPRRSNYQISSDIRRSSQRSRSLSGSITKFEYDIPNGKRILLNGEIIPCQISVKRSESPLREPEYIKLTKTPEGNSEDIRYVGLSKKQLNKRENLKMEYQNSNIRKYEPPRDRSRSRIIYVESSKINSENTLVCQHCSHTYSGSHHCLPQSEKKIKRLRSNSKKQLPNEGYLQHLNS